MKIVQLVTRNCVGGVQVVAKSLDAGLKKAGHEASVWYFCDSDEGIELDATSRCIFSDRSARAYYPRLLWRLFVALRRERPDVVIAHTTNTAVPGLILAAAAGTKRRIAVQHNPLDTYSDMARMADKVCGDLGAYWRNVTVAKTVSMTMGHYSKRASGRVRMIHNGMKILPMLRSTAEAEREEVLESFGVPSAGIVLLNVGRLAEQKNQSALLEAMSLVSGGCLLVCGDGPLGDSLRARSVEHDLRGKVVLAGAIDGAKVRRLMLTADIFVTPSHFEAMPMAVLEAMQAGMAIIGSDIEAHRELLGDAGLLVAGGARPLAEAMQHLIDHAELRKELGSRARERSLMFSEEAMVEAYVKVMSEAV